MVAPHTAPPPYQQPPGNGLAVAGMVLGILGLVLCWIPFVGWAAALVGIILGALGMSKAKKIGGRGKGMAVAGLVCGLVGLAIGIILFVLTMMASRAFVDYMEKGKKAEAALQLHSIEVKAKTFFIEKNRFPKSGEEMPGSIAGVCSTPNQRFAKRSQSEWEAKGWNEIGFHIDEDSRCSYEFISSDTSARAIARCDLDCDGTASETMLTLDVQSGNVVAKYTDPTPD